MTEDAASRRIEKLEEALMEIHRHCCVRSDMSSAFAKLIVGEIAKVMTEDDMERVINKGQNGT